MLRHAAGKPLARRATSGEPPASRAAHASRVVHARHAAAPVHARYFLRIPSPMQLNATIVTTIISPGASAHHGALKI